MSFVVSLVFGNHGLVRMATLCPECYAVCVGGVFLMQKCRNLGEQRLEVCWKAGRRLFGRGKSSCTY